LAPPNGNGNVNVNGNVNCGWVGRVGVPPNVTGRSSGVVEIDVVAAQQPQRHSAALAGAAK
jgi:hypothetical protein